MHLPTEVNARVSILELKVKPKLVASRIYPRLCRPQYLHHHFRHKDSNISSGFMTDLSGERCWQRDNVKLWAFGHTHFNCDFIETETGKRVVTNQRGYYFAQAAGFDSEKIVELGEVANLLGE